MRSDPLGPLGQSARSLVELAGAVHGYEVYAMLVCCVLDLLSDGGEHNGSASHVVDIGLVQVVCLHQNHLTFRKSQRFPSTPATSITSQVGKVPVFQFRNYRVIVDCTLHF